MLDGEPSGTTRAATASAVNARENMPASHSSNDNSYDEAGECSVTQTKVESILSTSNEVEKADDRSSEPLVAEDVSQSEVAQMEGSEAGGDNNDASKKVGRFAVFHLFLSQTMLSHPLFHFTHTSYEISG